MTGRELIIYILENNLEDKPVFEDGKILGLMTVEEAALKFGVGSATIITWFHLDMIKGIRISDRIYILADSVPVTLYEQK